MDILRRQFLGGVAAAVALPAIALVREFDWTVGDTVAVQSATDPARYIFGLVVDVCRDSGTLKVATVASSDGNILRLGEEDLVTFQVNSVHVAQLPSLTCDTISYWHNFCARHDFRMVKAA